MSLKNTKISVVVKGWPRLSETFIAQELVALEDQGLELQLFSLRHPYDDKTHELNRKLQAPVTYLPEYLHKEPGRVARCVFKSLFMKGFFRSFFVWLKDLMRDPSRNRIRRFGQACVLAAEMPKDIQHLYAHFLHTPASVTRYAALIRGLGWSFSAHAKDIWTSPGWEKKEKLASARWGATCTSYGAEHLKNLSPRPDDMHLVYHGLDFSRFPDPPERTGFAKPIRLLSVGRAVEKKGFNLLLDALANLPDDFNWHWTHIGKGELLKELQGHAARLNLLDNITWMGAQAHDEVIRQYRQSDIFVLPSRIAASGDRDGLPNVLMEAACQGLACLATDVSAIGEFIKDGETGRLVPPDDVRALGSALAQMMSNEQETLALGAAGNEHVRKNFSYESGINHLKKLFDNLA